MRDRRRDEDDYRGSRGGEKFFSRGRRHRSPRRAPTSEWEVNRTSRDSTSARYPPKLSRPRRRDRSRHRRQQAAHTSVSPSRESRTEHQELGDEPSFHRSRRRDDDASPPTKRRRSRSGSPSQGHYKKHRRSMSRSPHETDPSMSLSSANGYPIRHIDHHHHRHHNGRSSQSPEPPSSPNRNARSQKWDYPATVVQTDRPTSPPYESMQQHQQQQHFSSSAHRHQDHHHHHHHSHSHHRRTRSPISRPGTSSSSHPAHSHTEPRRFSPPPSERYEYSTTRRTSPRLTNDGEKDRRATIDQYSQYYSTEIPRRSNRYSPSPPRSRPSAADHSAPRSRRTSPSPPPGSMMSDRSGRHSPTPPSRPSTVDEHHRHYRKIRRSPPGGKSHRRLDNTESDALVLVDPSASSDEATMSRSGNRGPPSPPRPIPSFSDPDNHDSPHGDVRMREAFPMHGMKGSNSNPNLRRSARAPFEKHDSYQQSSQYSASTGHQHPPQHTPPYGPGRGWNGQSAPYPP